MISRPILTKKIKRNNTVYNLELWNTTDDEPQYIPTRNASGQFEPPSFKKDFFNDIAMNGTWPDAVNAAKYQERFDSWFDNLPLNKQKQYANQNARPGT